MKTFALAALASASAAAAISADTLGYVQYTARYNKVYGEINEFKSRFENFKNNTKMIDEHNATESNFKLGHNHFTDWHGPEYEKMLGLKNPWLVHKLPATKLDESHTHDSVNWKEAGCVTPVKD